jgi:LysM repeat protein
MTLRRSYVVLLVLILALSGCYRQASDPFETIGQPAVNTIVPLGEIAPDDVPDDDMDDSALPTLPPITVIPSTPVVPPTEAPDVEAQVDVEDESNGAPLTTDPLPVFTPSPTLTLITPIVPSGAGVIVTSAPEEAVIDGTATPSGLITPTSVFSAEEGCIYTVQSGDNLFRIAVNHNVGLPELRAANPQISGDLIQPGDRLTIPNCVPDAPVVGAPDPSMPSAIEAAPLGDQGIVGATGQTIHTVQSGETLQAIARRYNVTIVSIVEANNLADPNRLSVGQQLIIPGN